MSKDGSKELAPVYDNGNCLNSEWDDEKITLRTVFEEVEASVKMHYLAGKISIDDLNCIIRKYGIS